MRTVTGNDSPLARALSDELARRGLPAEDHLEDHGPRVCAVVAEPHDTSWLDPLDEDEPLDEARRAVSLRGGEIVLCTAREERDPGLRALRRSGLPYTVVRIGPAAEDVAARALVLPETLSAPVLSRAALARELSTEIAADRVGTGATIELGRSRSGRTVAEALRAAGRWAWVVPAWLFRMLSFVRLVPTFDADGAGRLVRQLGVRARRAAAALAATSLLLAAGMGSWAPAQPATPSAGDVAPTT